MRAAAVFSLLAVLARPAAAVTAPAGASATPLAGSATLAGESAFGTGWMVNAGYFFKDTMFYSGGRGGLHISVGKMVALPYGLGLWTGAGTMRSRGTYESTLADGARYRTAFDLTVAYADLGIATPFTPFPIGVVVYRQAGTLDDTGLTGPQAGRALAARDRGWGIGLDVHLLFEWFLRERRGRSRGPALVIGYEGFMDLSARTVAATDAAGGRVEHRLWKPLKGESLRGGLEWEF